MHVLRRSIAMDLLQQGIETIEIYLHASMAMRGATDLRDGCFDKDRMIDLAQEMLEAGTQQGLALTRIIAVSR